MEGIIRRVFHIPFPPLGLVFLFFFPHRSLFLQRINGWNMKGYERIWKDLSGFSPALQSLLNRACSWLFQNSSAHEAPWICPALTFPAPKRTWTVKKGALPVLLSASALTWGTGAVPNSCSKVQQKHNRGQMGMPGVPRLSQGCRRWHRGQLQVPPGHCCPAHLADPQVGLCPTTDRANTQRSGLCSEF